ncbi:MAG: YbaB/EbfC family nucleoid-associated protein [Firmicutes bacterium]|nr:YbaB/EbfC family nucleoid-associated protein [Bacillota bacterium]
MSKGGFGGGGGMNMQAMLKQAQKLKEQMEEAQKELEETEIEAEAGGGLVAVTLNGKKRLLAIKIKPEAVDPDDLEMLEDLILAAYNEAYSDAEELEAELLPAGANALF